MVRLPGGRPPCRGDEDRQAESFRTHSESQGARTDVRLCRAASFGNTWRRIGRTVETDSKSREGSAPVTTGRPGQDKQARGPGRPDQVAEAGEGQPTPPVV